MYFKFVMVIYYFLFEKKNKPKMKTHVISSFYFII